eukprot:scaffold99301_cov30-Tisochrysis_lutea.AAC.1
MPGREGNGTTGRAGWGKGGFELDGCQGSAHRLHSSCICAKRRVETMCVHAIESRLYGLHDSSRQRQSSRWDSAGPPCPARHYGPHQLHLGPRWHSCRSFCDARLWVRGSGSAGQPCFVPLRCVVAGAYMLRQNCSRSSSVSRCAIPPWWVSIIAHVSRAVLCHGCRPAVLML